MGQCKGPTVFPVAAGTDPGTSREGSSLLALQFLCFGNLARCVVQVHCSELVDGLNDTIRGDDALGKQGFGFRSCTDFFDSIVSKYAVWHNAIHPDCEVKHVFWDITGLP